MKVIISAGGTGGHIYPALAIIRALKEKHKNVEILYIGTKDRMESKIIPKEGIQFLGIEMKGMNRKNPFANFSVVSLLFKNISYLKKVMMKEMPDIVIGVGGYVTFPVVYAAHACGIKTVIHEQNSIFGLTNKMLSRYVDAVFTSFKETTPQLKNTKVVFTGNPRSEEVAKVEKANKRDYGLKDAKKTVLVVMGSLGSLTVSEKFLNILPEFKNKDYEVLFVTGNSYYEKFQGISVPNVKIVPFLDNMLGVLKFSDVVVSRAGASMISEITTCGVPSVLIPSPYVTANHQYKNAKALEEVGASILLEEDKLNAKNLIDSIDSILKDQHVYDKMVVENKKLGIEKSATKIVLEIENILKEDKNG